MEAKLDAVQRDGLIKDDPNSLFTVFRSPPPRSVLGTQCGFNGEGWIFRRDLDCRDLFKV
jgi:hypothetical protein